MDTALLKPLTKEQEDAILAESEYSREQLKADLEQIKEWLENQDHLPPSRLKESDTFLEHYLTGCKGSLEKVKKKLDCYYTIRGYSELFDNRDPTEANYMNMKEICDVTILPEPMADGTRLLIGTFVDKEADKFDFTAYCRYVINRYEVFMRLAGLGTKLFMLYNSKGASPSVVLKMRPSIVRDVFVFMEQALPFRYVKLVGINTAPFIEVASNNIVKPLLPKKLKERYHIYGSEYGELFNAFSPSILPRDYGGLSTNPSLKEYSDRWSKNEVTNRQWFLNDLSEKNDETKRISLDYLSQNPHFGVHGSLKKLVVD